MIMQQTDQLPEMPAEIAGMTYEEALAELESTIGKLEEGTAPLAETVELFERGCTLRLRCQSLLDEAQGRIDRIVESDGNSARE